jgi:hypothetical protein
MTVRATQGRLSALSVSRRKSILYGGSVLESRALNGPFRRFRARVVNVVSLEGVKRGHAEESQAELAAPDPRLPAAVARNAPKASQPPPALEHTASTSGSDQQLQPARPLPPPPEPAPEGEVGLGQLRQMAASKRPVLDTLVAGLEAQVRQTPSRLGQLQSFITVFHSNAWANSHILGQPNTFLASGRGMPGFRARGGHAGCNQARTGSVFQRAKLRRHRTRAPQGD